MPQHAPLPTWNSDELAAWLRLALTDGVGNATARRLLMQYGAPQEIFQTSAAALQSCASAAQAEQLTQVPPQLAAQLETTWQWLENPPPGLGHALITLGDPRYPESLLHTEDPPLMLYAIGPAAWLARSAPIVEMNHCIAMVGTRNPTAQGAENARHFAKELARMGWSVVSGMAAGIDGAAHQGALQALDTWATPGYRPITVAVLGTGIDRVYPRSHHDLSHAVAQSGLLLSELPLGTPPLANNFPKRNRIISGLSRGVLVVEAALASGTMITARLASEQGREVFAIPGSIHAPQSRGCHALIRQGAKLVETAQDIAEELLPASANTALRRDTEAAPNAPPHTAPTHTAEPAATSTSDSASHDEHPVLQALGYDPVGLDALQARTGLDIAQLQAQLLELELDGCVAALPGGLFQRLHRS